MSTGNQKLIQLLNNLREQMYRYRVECIKRKEAHPRLMAEHAEIIRRIEEHEKEKAAEIVSRHIDNQAEVVTDVIRTKHGE